MPVNECHFVTRWSQPAPPDTVFAVIDDAAGLARWWPSVYLNIDILNADRTAASLDTKGWLPSTLRWMLRVTERRSLSFLVAPIPAPPPATPTSTPAWLAWLVFRR